MADAVKISARLLERYPQPHIALEYTNPLELLVATLLSAQCTDARVNAVTRTLFSRYRTAADYANADLATLEQEVRPTGFYRNKARTLVRCAQMLVAEFGGQVPDSVAALTRLPGVGRKTANMVLGNAFGRQTIAVDTHVLRVSNRLGLVASNDAQAVEARLAAQVPGERHTAFTNAMILHGRETCVARRPHCCACVLHPLCEWPDKPPCGEASR